MDPTSIIAKLLANENIHVVQSNASTASFDLQNRTLTLPKWKNVSTDVEQMLICHEVGHALYTPPEYMDIAKANPEHASCLNILEDPRIERMVKRRYMGTRKTFNTAYKELYDLDFFNVKNKDVQTLHFLDRLNLYFKLGTNISIEFSEDEMPLVKRAETTESFNDVIQLMKDIVDYLETKAQEMPDLEYEYEFTDTDDESDDEEGEFLATGTTVVEDAEDGPITDKALERNISSLTDSRYNHQYYDLVKPTIDVVVPFTKIIADMKSKISGDLSDVVNSRAADYVNFKTNTQANVNYLVKEFEMRKAATAYKRTHIAKSGQLDVKKIWKYKLEDDIFRRISVVREGKNHGMVFLLDWSGSMSNVIHDAVEQIINLAMFCQRAGIKYRVYAFTDHMNYAKYVESPDLYSREQERDKIIPDRNRLALLEMFSDRMSNSQFNEMAAFAHSYALIRVAPLHATPLNEALSYLYFNLADFQREGNIEKISLITLTDGQGGTMYTPGPAHNDYNKISKLYIKEPTTKSNLPWDRYDSTTQTQALINMIKLKYNCAIVGFYIAPSTNFKSIRDVFHNHFDVKSSWNLNQRIDAARSDIKQNGYASIKGTGRDDLFVLAAKNLKIDEGTLEKVTPDSSARVVAKQFAKYLNTKKTSRVLLDKLIGYIA